MKIYTRTGDSGETGLFDGTRVAKSNPRVAAYGDVDELGACLGAVRARQSWKRTCARCWNRSSEICSRSARALPIPRTESLRASGRRPSASEDIARLEGWIDSLEADLPPLRRFILAGGSQSGAALHVARAICRRAERAMVGLGSDAYEPELLTYVNRLSDLLFVMARSANHRAGAPELEW